MKHILNDFTGKRRKSTLSANTIIRQDLGTYIFMTYSACLIKLCSWLFFFFPVCFSSRKDAKYYELLLQNFRPQCDLVSPCFIWQAVLSKMTCTDEVIVHEKGERKKQHRKSPEKSCVCELFWCLTRVFMCWKLQCGWMGDHTDPITTILRLLPKEERASWRPLFSLHLSLCKQTLVCGRELVPCKSGFRTIRKSRLTT